MILCIPQVLLAEEITTVTNFLARSEFVDGKLTAGTQASRVKHNLQLNPNAGDRQAIDTMLIEALYRHELIQNFAFPKQIFSLLFSKYELGMYYGTHIDNPLMNVGQLQRTDLSVTLFLSAPSSYDGGELTIETSLGPVKVKLPAGDAVVYPSSNLHQVEPVTRGVRLAAVAWIQSFIRDRSQRELLYELGQVRSSTPFQSSASRESALLQKIHFNLIRMWAEV